MNRMNIKARQVAFPEQVRGIFVAGLLLLATNFAGAQNVTQNQLTARYPSGSIQSTEIANQALADVDQQRAQLDPKIRGPAACLLFQDSWPPPASMRPRKATARFWRRFARSRSKPILSSAARRVVERDKRLAEKRARDANNPPKPVTDTADARPQPPSASDPHRIAEHEASAERQSNKDAQQRADNVAAFEKESPGRGGAPARCGGQRSAKKSGKPREQRKAALVADAAAPTRAD